MILAAPLVIPFAKAVGLSVGTLGMAALADKVNDYIEANPEESAMILKTLIPNLGIGEIFMNKEKISIEDLDEMSDQEAADLPTDIKADLMKQGGKSRGGGKRELMKELSRKLGLSGPGKEQKDMEYDADERYEGGVTEKADGGAIGVESLFEERVPFRFGGGYQGGKSSAVDRGPSARDRAMGSGGKQKGGTNTKPSGGPGGSTSTPTPTKTKTINPFSKQNQLTHFKNNQLLADAVKKGILTNKEYNILGGYDATQTLGLGPLDTGLASLSYNVAQSVLGNQPFSDIPGDVARNVKGATNISPELKAKYENIIGQNLAEGGRVGFNVGGITDPAALAIYNSMNAYGFSDQEIADTITAQGYDAGTLGQGPSIPTPVPVAPEPSEGIIGIDLQERGGGFNPFGPLQSTFTKDLTDVDMYKGVNVEGLTPVQQMNKYRTATQDNMFGLGRFFQPKIRGTLGTRLANQPRLPLPASIAAYSMSPFNPDSKNYNPDFVNQLNYLEGMDGLIGMSSVGLKYGPESVLAGKNVISGFGTNNYQKALEKFIKDTKSKKRKEQGEIELQNFLDAEKARKEREAKEQLEIQRAATREADRRAGAFDDRVRLDPGGGGTFKEQTAAKERQGVQVAGPGFGKGAYFAEGGLASMFAEKR
jgi:hypothetical protein